MLVKPITLNAVPNLNGLLNFFCMFFDIIDHYTNFPIFNCGNINY